MASYFRSAKPCAGTTMATETDLSNDIVINNPAEDSISDIAFSPQHDFMFSVSSWDNKVRVWDVSNGNPQTRTQYEHTAPVLSTRWSADGTKIASGGCDNAVKLFDVNTSQAQQVGNHDAPVQSVRFVQCGPTNSECLVTGSWDKTLKYWDMRQPQPISTINLPERVYSMDSKQQLLVVGMADRHIAVINLSNPGNIFKTVQSPLKMQTRTVSCYNTGDGYAVGSVEGRIAIRYIDDEQQRKSGFSFKCHRDSKGTRAVGASSQSNVYAVNCIAFHPVYGTFVSAGSDGSFHFWDKNQRHRLKGFPAQNGSIPVCNFNRQGSLLAYSISYDWSKGVSGSIQGYPNVIRLHPTNDAEVKEKQK